MATQNEKPTYNLKVVLQETGLKPDTLRAWERRYGIPQPIRTPGGHRLYSTRDIETLKWLIARQQEGLSISRAVSLWQQLLAEKQNPLQEVPLSGATPAEAYLPERSHDNKLAELRQGWILACFNFDEQQADYMVTQAFALYPQETVCIELLQKGIAQLGEGWLNRKVTVQQEHFASALATRRLEALISAAPHPTRNGRVLVCCPPEENHTFSLLLLTLFLRRQGWEVIYLGASVPLIKLEVTLSGTQPRLVILSAQRLFTAARLLEMAQLLYIKEVSLAYGGLIFNTLPALRNRIPGHFLGTTIQQAVTLANGLMLHEAQPVVVEAVSPEYQQALVQYRERKASIEAEIWAEMKLSAIPRPQLSEANNNISTNIMAALELGSMDYLGTDDITWLEEIPVNYDISPDTLAHYLHIYYQAATHYLGPECQPILVWLAGLSK